MRLSDYLQPPPPCDLDRAKLNRNCRDGNGGRLVFQSAVQHMISRFATKRLAQLIRDGIDLEIKYAIDIGRGGNEAEIANKLTLDILELCEGLGIRPSAVLPRPRHKPFDLLAQQGSGAQVVGRHIS